MKQTIKLKESELRSYITETVKKSLNEIGNTAKGQDKLGRVSGRSLARGIFANKNDQKKYFDNAAQASCEAERNNPVDGILSKIEELLTDLWLHWGANINVEEIMKKLRMEVKKVRGSIFNQAQNDEYSSYLNGPDED